MSKDEKKPVAKPRYTTFRLYGQDGDDLSDYADSLGQTIAETYRTLGFAERVRAELLKVTEAKLKRLKDQK